MSVRAKRSELTHPHKASIALQRVKIDDPIPVVKPMGRPLEWTVEKVDALADEMLEWLKNPKNLYFNRFLLTKGLIPSYAEIFAKRSDYFLQAYNLARAYQEQRLVELAVSKQGDGNFIKFMLCAKSGWKDQSTVNHNLNPLASLLDKIALEAKEPIVIEVSSDQA